MKNTKCAAGLLGVGAIAILGACASGGGPELMPAPGAETVTGPGLGVESTRAGVHVAAFADAWDAPPDDLETVLTPILVRIRNEGTVPIAIRYDSFQLTGLPGGPLSPIPPYRIEEDIVEPIPFGSTYLWRDFYVAPYLSRFYPYARPFDGDFIITDGIYRRSFPQYVTIELPTPAMIAFALPEGVLDPGGEATGFLYFPELKDEDEVPTVLFVADLVNSETGQQFASVTLPFAPTD